MKRYGYEYLEGESIAFKRVLDLRNKECGEYTIEKKLEQIRTSVKDAWFNKDYRTIVELLSPVEERFLSSAEIKKLEYARKQS